MARVHSTPQRPFPFSHPRAYIPAIANRLAQTTCPHAARAPPFRSLNPHYHRSARSQLLSATAAVRQARGPGGLRRQPRDPLLRDRAAGAAPQAEGTPAGERGERDRARRGAHFGYHPEGAPRHRVPSGAPRGEQQPRAPSTPPAHLLQSSARKWGTGRGGEKRGRVFGVLSAPLPLLAQEDPWGSVRTCGRSGNCSGGRGCQCCTALSTRSSSQLVTPPSPNTPSRARPLDNKYM
eukprot:1194096-Prorocentrum_minimum.AAC.5